MNELSDLPVHELDAMKSRLTNWLVGIVALDVLVLAAFVLVLVTKSPKFALPLVPLLMLPGIALVPFLKRLGAVKKELARRNS